MPTPITAKIKTCIPKESKLIVAVSGGCDSVVLLEAMMQIKAELRLDLAVAHVNHNLREESPADADFVAKLAKRHGLSFFSKDCLEIPDSNIEAWGRAERYDFFTYLLKSEGYDWLLTAHTASDQAETLLMKLFANRELQTIERIDLRRKLIRPLLEFSRKQVEEFARLNKLQYREDISNRDTEFFRNQIRHKILPFLESEIEGNLSSILAERAEVLNEDLFSINFVAQQLFSELSADKHTKEWKEQFRKVLLNLPISISWRMVEFLLLPDIGFKIGRFAALRALDVYWGKVVATELPGGYRLAAKDAGFLLSKI